jgi:hypothetical protein
MTTAAQPHPTTAEPVKPRLTLYDLAEELLAWEALVQAEDGEVTAELEELETELLAKIEQKADRFGAFFKQLELDRDRYGDEADRVGAIADGFKAKAKATTATMDRLKNLVDRALVATGRDKFAGELFTLARQKNGGRPKVTLLVPVQDLPEHYQAIPPVEVSADLKALAEALAANDPEALKVAEFAPATFRVVIK